MESKGCFIGVDLGGTNVRAQALYEDGTAAGERFENPSRAQTGTEAILDSLTTTIRQAIAAAKSEVLGVGIAVPGHVDDAAGIVRWAPNFGHEVDGVFISWRNVPLKPPLQEKIPLPISMGNDANLAALGEYRFGVGEGKANCLAMLTLGTGIGGGVVMAPTALQGDTSGPVLLVGGNKGGGELGHIVVLAGGADSTSGAYGTLEAYCQRDAIVRRAVNKILRGNESAIRDLVDGELGRVTPRTITQAADLGDPVALEVWAEIGYFLGVGIGNIINIFAPDLFAIGGKISSAGPHLMGPAERSARHVAVPSLWSDCKLVLASLADEAGMLGGLALAAERHRIARQRP